MLGDAELQFDHDLNSEYVEFHERATKTRTGININDMRPCAPRMYASPEFPERCTNVTEVKDLKIIQNLLTHSTSPLSPTQKHLGLIKNGF